MTREIGDIVKLWESRPGEAFALATLVGTRGSSYRLPGARMLIASDGMSAGSLSGGCLEEEVIQHSREVIRSGTPSLLTIDTRLRFGCHGSIAMLVERAGDDFLAGLAERRRDRRCGRAATTYEGEFDLGSRWLRDDEIVSRNAFVQEILPSLQLLVIGDGPDCVALRQFSSALGWSWRQVENASQLRGGYDEWTAALVKTHNFGRDFAALRALLPMGLRYVGLLGPRRRREQLLGDLLDTGVQVSENLFAPAGQNLGGDAPESIALAVIAEIHAVFAARPGNHLRDIRAPIHPDRQNDSNALAFGGIS